MTGKDIYKIWAPVNKKWVDWIRPVPFIMIDENYKVEEYCNLKEYKINYLEKYENNIAIIVDLPGLESINEGISLARLGFRPVPVYNGVVEQKDSKAVTNNYIIGEGLIWGAEKLKQIEILEDAAPAFLVDSNRMNRFKMDDSYFDNSWDLYYQDVPSSEYFLKNNINKIIIRGNKINRDLNKILFEFQKKGLEIYFTDGFDIPKKVKLKKVKLTKYDD